jgi:hypothetical protein
MSTRDLTKEFLRYRKERSGRSAESRSAYSYREPNASSDRDRLTKDQEMVDLEFGEDGEGGGGGAAIRNDEAGHKLWLDNRDIVETNLHEIYKTVEQLKVAHREAVEALDQRRCVVSISDRSRGMRAAWRGVWLTVGACGGLSREAFVQKSRHSARCARAGAGESWFAREGSHGTMLFVDRFFSRAVAGLGIIILLLFFRGCRRRRCWQCPLLLCVHATLRKIPSGE